MRADHSCKSHFQDAPAPLGRLLPLLVALCFCGVAQSQGNGLLLSAQQLSFTAVAGGDAPAPQSFSVTSLVATEALPYTIRLEAASFGLPVPTWLSVQPSKGGVTPGRIQVSADQSGLAVGSYSARLAVGSAGHPDLPVAVTLNVQADTNPDTSLDLLPRFLRFSPPASSGPLRQTVLVGRASGGGPVDFEVSVPDNLPWLSVSPARGRTLPNQPVPVVVSINPARLPGATAFGVVRFGSQNLPVTVLVNPSGPVMGLNFNGLRFNARLGNGNSDVRNVLVLNLGAGNVNWQAEVIAGKNVVSLNPSRGQSAAGGFSRLGVAVTPAGLREGTYYALVRVTDALAAGSPQYVTVVLEVTGATGPTPFDPSPQGLFFVADSGGAATASQPIRLFVSSTAPVAFQASASTADGGDWLSVKPTTGVTSTASTAELAVVADPAKLKPGVYTGDVTLALPNQEIRTTNITVVVPSKTATPASSAIASAVQPPADPPCAASKLSLTQTGLINSFSARAGWPVPLIVRLADDCGDPVRNASVVANFSSGDAPLPMALTNNMVGLYSATWTPGRTVPSTSVTVRATAPGLASAASVVIGAVNSNPIPPPVLNSNGVLDIFNPLSGSPLAPGSVAQAYGTNLAQGALPAPAIPLTTSLAGTTLLIGGYEAPVYYVSPGQVNVQIPMDLDSNRQHAVLVSANGQYSVSDSLTLAPAQPGLLAGVDGQIIAQHSDFSLISDARPAKAGETIAAYLSGLGATSPAVASGSASNGNPLATALIKPTATIDGKNATVVFAGLSPGFVGLYQVNVTVPADVKEGRVPLVVIQNGVPSNAAMLPVIK